ncbi:MAG: hypothetical protein H7X97_07555 [Opitutaceae bacterium]|nr:hypothetical protein [Verrucomicrobiales bacterium]
MQQVNFEEVLEEILAGDHRYAGEAYLFLREALDFTQKRATTKSGKIAPRHVTGQELLEGIREYALDQFGPMAMTVCDEWGIRCGEDFGQIVFIMIEHKLLGKTDQDNPDDFRGGYDFDDAFRKPFLPQSRIAAPPPAPASKPA